jgi:lactocepin
LNLSFTEEVDLQPGKNVFKIEALDLAGHKTEKEISIYRSTGEDDQRVERISGDNRYQTAIQISKEGWETSDVVVVARGDNYADALAGVPLAAKYDAPVLLTNSNKLTQSTKEEIIRLGAKEVYILGGTAAVSDQVKAELEDLEVTTTRLVGATRFETAAVIAKDVAPEGTNKVVVVNGYNFPDALSVASYAGSEGLPILLTSPDKLLETTAAAITGLGATESLVIGGTAVISSEVFVDLPNATRLSGKSRFTTNIAIAEYFNKDAEEIYVATGYQFADALTGAALAAKKDTGILLVGKGVPSEVEEHLNNHDVKKLKVLGGKEVVSDKLLQSLHNLLK